jgi:hypothetical protein
VQESFTHVKFIRDDLHQLQAVIAYCAHCREERAPVVVPMAWGPRVCGVRSANRRRP